MKINTLSTMKYGIIAIFIAFACSQVTVKAQVERSLEGVWEARTTPRNCTTGDPIPAAAFESLYTFHRDRTMASWYSSGTPAAGHGLWRRENGWNSYSFKLIRILRTPAGVYSGKQVLGGTIELNEAGDEYTSDEYMIVYGIDGVPTTQSCINSVGRRFKLD